MGEHDTTISYGPGVLAFRPPLNQWEANHPIINRYVAGLEPVPTDTSENPSELTIGAFEQPGLIGTEEMKLEAASKLGHLIAESLSKL